MKISARAFVKAALETAQGQALGEIAGQQERMRREQQRDAFLLQNIQRFDKPGQDKLLGYLFQGEQNRAQGRPSDYGMQGEPAAQFGGGMFRPSLPPSPSQPTAATTVPGVTPPPAQPMPAAAAPPMTPPGPTFQRGNFLGLPPGVAGPPTPFSKLPMNALLGAGAAPAPQMPAPAVVPAQQPVGQTAVAPPVAAAPVPQAPVARPAAAPTPQQPAPKRRGINVPGLGFLAFRGVDPKEVAAEQKRVDALRSQLFNAYSTSSEAQRNLQEIVADIPTNPQTEEEFARMQQGRSRLQQMLVGLGPSSEAAARTNYGARAEALDKQIGNLQFLSDEDLVPSLLAMGKERGSLIQASQGRPVITGKLAGQGKNLEELQRLSDAGDLQHAAALARTIAGSLQSKLTPKQEGDAFRRTLQLMGQVAPQSLEKNPELRQQIIDSQGVGYLFAGIDPMSLKFGGDTVEKRWADMTRDLSSGRLANLGEGARQQWFNEYAGLARLTGRKLDLTPADLAKLGPREQVKLWRDRQLFNWRGQEHEFRMFRAKVDLERSRLGLEKLRAEKSAGWKKGGKGELTAYQRIQTVQGLANKALDAYQKHLKGAYLDVQGFDPASADVNDPRQKRAKDLYDNWQRLQKNATDQMIQSGIDPNLLMRLGDNAAAGGGEAGTGTAGVTKQAPPKKKSFRDMSDDELIRWRPGQ